jgi:hypothetical protein
VLDNGFLGVEIVEERAGGNAGCGGDVASGGGFEALFAEGVDGGIENPLASGGFLFNMSTFILSCEWGRGQERK